MKKLLLLLTVPFLMTACFGGDDEEIATNGENQTVAEAGETLYETSDFSIVHPQDWEVIESDKFTSNVPLETVVDFRNNIKSEVFTANLVVSIANIEETLSASDFGKNSLAKAKNSLVAFQEIKKEIFNETFYLIEFEGKKSASDPVLHFQQLHATSGTAGFVVTATYLPAEDESVVIMIDEMLNSFSLK